MTNATEEIMLEGLRQALIATMGNLYRVFTSLDRDQDHEGNFMRGVERNAADYERMIALITKREG